MIDPRARSAREAGQVDGVAVIRPAVDADARAIAKLHADALPGSFLASLGPRFLTRMYHGLLADPDVRTFVGVDGDTLTAFVCGALDASGAVRRGRLRSAGAAFPRVLRPSVLRRAFETARYAPPPGLPPAELLTIAVAPDARRAGTGRELVDALSGALRFGGASGMRVVAGATLDAANRFYASLGFRHAATVQVHRGERSNVWVITWPS